MKLSRDERQVEEHASEFRKKVEAIKALEAHGYDEPPTLDMINHPNHYKGRNGLESIEIIQNFATDEMEMGFYWGNAMKYMTRYRNKNGLEDLKKARKNLDWLIEKMESQQKE